MRARRTTMGALALIAASGIAACGSSGSSKTTSGSGSTPTTASTASTSAGSSKPAATGTVNGAGSTLAAPIYEQWASTLKSSGLTVNYNAVGSGTGQTDLASKTVAFAGSDPSLKPADLTAFKGTVDQFPVAAGAITVSYNLPGVKSGLKLTGPVIAEIFSGKITKWNNSAITSLNPGVSLPSATIHTVYRSDSSGTTNGFTTYLSDVDPTWAKTIGAGKTVKWPVGEGAAKNAGVAAAVKQTSDSIGYVEQAYAIISGFTYASVQNSAKQFVAPSIPATSAAFTGIKVPANLAISTINSPNAAAYPIVSQTFLDVYADPCKDGGLSESQAEATWAFLNYALGAGQSTLGANTSSGQLPYAPVPASLQAKDQAQLKAMTCNGKALTS